MTVSLACCRKPTCRSSATQHGVRRRITIIQHPYTRLSTLELKVSSLGSAILFLVSIVIFAKSVPLAHINAVSLFVQSSDETAQALLTNWNSQIRESFRFMLGYDYLFDIIHNNLVALFVVWGAKRLATYAVLSLSAFVSWVLWFDSALNIFENLAYSHILTSNIVAPWHAYASLAFGFRSTTLIVAAIIGTTFHLLAFRRQNEV